MRNTPFRLSTRTTVVVRVVVVVVVVVRVVVVVSNIIRSVDRVIAMCIPQLLKDRLEFIVVDCSTAIDIVLFEGDLGNVALLRCELLGGTCCSRGRSLLKVHHRLRLVQLGMQQVLLQLMVARLQLVKALLELLQLGLEVGVLLYNQRQSACVV
jgi:hypothetical protein